MRVCGGGGRAQHTHVHVYIVTYNLDDFDALLVGLEGGHGGNAAVAGDVLQLWPCARGEDPSALMLCEFLMIYLKFQCCASMFFQKPFHAETVEQNHKVCTKPHTLVIMMGMLMVMCVVA